jgi:hypothetical protein
LLEIEGETKGVLIPRILLNDATTEAPLTAPVLEGMLIYNEGGTEENGFYYWDGNQYRLIITSVNTAVRDNFVRVKSEADFPAPSGGILTLTAGTVYEINGTISLTNSIDLNGAYVIGVDANNDVLFYTPSSGSMFTGSNGGTIKTITMVAANSGAKIFDVTDVTGRINLF